ncbi:MAG: AI-2E family transporter [Gallionellaceae bacterium]
MDQRNKSGPVVWTAIIATTCLLLLVSQKLLWLMVPFLLALILYYILYPATQSFINRGMSRDEAAVWTIVLFLMGLVVGLSFMVPWITIHIVDIQASFEFYLDGGLLLLNRSLQALEASWPAFAKVHLADTVTLKLQAWENSIVEHAEPLVMSIAAWTSSLLLTPFLAFYFLKDGQRFKRFLAHAVPNAFFERTLNLLHEVDQTLHAYFTGLMKLAVLDTVTLAAGLWIVGFPNALALGSICAVLAMLPYVGTILGGLAVILVAATNFPDTPTMAYWAALLFIIARLLDDFVYMPLTIGKSLHMSPLVAVLMIFVGGAVAGVSGLMLALPLLGVVMVVGETISKVVTDPRLMARHRHAKALRRKLASADLIS